MPALYLFDICSMFAGRLLDVCSMVARSCKRGIRHFIVFICNVIYFIVGLVSSAVSRHSLTLSLLLLLTSTAVK